MPWNNQGDGGGPWGGGQGPWGRGSGGGSIPPDFDALLRKSRDRFRRIMPGGMGPGRGIGLAALAIIALWILTGLYKVDPEEVGVVLRFGSFSRITEPGLNYHLPSPIETVTTVPVTRINRIELGYQTTGDGGMIARRDSTDESLMLTGDENIVDINFSVFWQIRDPRQYLFDIRDPEGTVKDVAESAMREIIGQMPIRAPLSEDRQLIVDRTKVRMQELLDRYKSGISVVQVQLLKADPPSAVIDAFNDVQRAKADQERASNEAEAYQNDIIPKAKGDATRIVQEAQGYKQQVIDQAEGDAKRFLSVYQAYKAAPDVTEQRLYLDTMQALLKSGTKIVIDPSVKGVVPYLPLPDLGRAKKPAADSDPKTGDAK
jgi:membrane protease subunit HflK